MRQFGQKSTIQTYMPISAEPTFRAFRPDGTPIILAYRKNGEPVYDWLKVHDSDIVPYIIRIDHKSYIYWSDREWKAIHEMRKMHPEANIIGTIGSVPEMLKMGWI
jgi:hypothetical protein